MTTKTMIRDAVRDIPSFRSGSYLNLRTVNHHKRRDQFELNSQLPFAPGALFNALQVNRILVHHD